MNIWQRYAKQIDDARAKHEGEVSVDIVVLEGNEERRTFGTIGGGEASLKLDYEGEIVDLSGLNVIEFKFGEKHGFSFEYEGKDIFVESNGHTKQVLQKKMRLAKSKPNYLGSNVLATA